MLVGAGGIKTRWHLADPAYLVLALLPWVLLAFDSRWIYNPLINIDSWIYFGYFQDYPRYVAELFPDRYYGSRLSWILPGYCLHALFDPAIARYILHLSFYYLAVFSLYGLLRKAVGARTALLGAILFGTYSFFLRAIGWDYVDGAGITYNLLALLCIAQAVASRRPWLWLGASGAAAAAMFYCNAFLAVFLPFLPAFYIYQVQRGFTRFSLRMACRFVLWCGFGALLVTLILGAVNYRVGGRFWFYLPSLQFIADFSSRGNSNYRPGWTWAVPASWLGLPLMAALGSISYLLMGTLRGTFVKQDLRFFFVLQYLGCAGIMAVSQMSGGAGLQLYYYASYLLPSAFLAIGCLLALHLERWPGLTYWLVLALVTLAFAASLRLDKTEIAAHVRDFGWITLSVSAGLCLILNGMLRSRWQMLLLILCGFWLYQTGFGLSGLKVDQQGPVHLSRIAEGAKLVREHTGEDPLKFWYNLHDPLGREFEDINSTYLWSWAMISQDFPAIPPQPPLQLGVDGVILSSQNDALQQANRALNESHLAARALGTGRIDRDGVSYQLLFFRTEALGTREPEVPLELSARGGQIEKPLLLPQAGDGAFPRERWSFYKFPPTGGHMEVQPEGVHVTTHPGKFSYAVKYGPITAVKSGVYRFVLEYADLNGGLEFYLLSGDESHWLVLPRTAQRRGGKGTRTVYASLSAGEQVVLLVSNFVFSGPERSSTFVIKSVRGFGAFNK